MHTAMIPTPQPKIHSFLDYRKKEKMVFASIPGMHDLIHAHDENQRAHYQDLYPDAAFALMIASNLFCPNRELNAIYLQAYQAILNEEKIESVRYRFGKEIDTYWNTHMWDD